MGGFHKAVAGKDVDGWLGSAPPGPYGGGASGGGDPWHADEWGRGAFPARWWVTQGHLTDGCGAPCPPHPTNRHQSKMSVGQWLPRFSSE